MEIWLWSFYGGQKVGGECLTRTPRGCIVDLVQTETRPGGRDQTKGTTMTSTATSMPVRAYAVHFTDDNVYCTYESLRRQGRFSRLVRYTDPDGNTDTVPEGTGWDADGELLSFEDSCKQLARDLLWEVAERAQEIFEDSTNNNDPVEENFFNAEDAMELAFKKSGWNVDMVTFVPRETIVCDDTQTVAIVTPRGISFLF
nr:MAG TPA_asm: hypothetical protein [Caudoviricetes sp.]